MQGGVGLRDVIYQGPAISDDAALERLPSELRRLLRQLNGFIALGGALHVRGVCLLPDWHSLAEVTSGAHALHRLFPSLRRDDVPFAQDCIGDQFILRKGGVYKLSVAAAALDFRARTLDRFLAAVSRHPDAYLALPSLAAFQRRGGVLSPGQLLAPRLAAGGDGGHDRGDGNGDVLDPARAAVAPEGAPRMLPMFERYAQFSPPPRR